MVTVDLAFALIVLSGAISIGVAIALAVWVDDGLRPAIHTIVTHLMRMAIISSLAMALLLKALSAP